MAYANPDFESYPRTIAPARKVVRLPANRRNGTAPARRSAARPATATRTLRRPSCVVFPPSIPSELHSTLGESPEYLDALADFTPQELQLLALGDYETLEGFKLKKFFKKVGKAVGKVLAVPAGIVGGAIGLKPGLFGIKSEKAKKRYKKLGKVGRVLIGVGAAALLLPLVLPTIASGASTAVGALKFAGGKLLSAPLSVIKMLTGAGKDPKTATPEEVLEAAEAAGVLTGKETVQITEPEPTYAPEPVYRIQPAVMPRVEAPVYQAGMVPVPPVGLEKALPWILGAVGGSILLSNVLAPRPAERRR